MPPPFPAKSLSYVNSISSSGFTPVCDIESMPVWGSQNQEIRPKFAYSISDEKNSGWRQSKVWQKNNSKTLRKSSTILMIPSPGGTVQSSWSSYFMILWESFLPGRKKINKKLPGFPNVLANSCSYLTNDDRKGQEYLRGRRFGSVDLFVPRLFLEHSYLYYVSLFLI